MLRVSKLTSVGDYGGSRINFFTQGKIIHTSKGISESAVALSM